MRDTDAPNTKDVGPREQRATATDADGNPMDSNGSDVEHFGDALRATGQFVYANSHRLVAVSLAWTLASLPIVTVGPASLGAYVAVMQLESDRNRLEPRRLLATVGERAVTATLFGLFPLVLFAISGLYLYAQITAASPLRAALFFLTLYAGCYAALVMVPTFVGLADGRAARPALVAGVRWTAAHPTLTMLTGLITVIILTASLLLTVAFPLLFAGVAAAFHVHIVDLDTQ